MDFPLRSRASFANFAKMKRVLPLLLVTMLSGAALADIHDPPMADQGPTRKLGRGLSNIMFGFTEVPTTIAVINEREGNSAALSYGVVRGFGRFFYRFGKGVYEVVTHPFPTYKDSYRPPYRSNIPWINGGLTEFPPELGFETRYRYTRNYGAYAP
jgi:putative exosortase-associated protein (TIGR04073 family)